MKRLRAACFAWVLALACACCGAGDAGGPAAKGSVVGRCVDSSRTPLAGVDVRFEKSARSVKSDANGCFRLEFSFDGHLDTLRSAVRLERDPLRPVTVPVVLEDGETIDLGDLSLE
jgi:hypothetical protein